MKSLKKVKKRKKRTKKTEKRPSIFEDIMLLVLKMGLIGLLFVLLFSFVFGISRVTDNGMENSFKDGDIVVYYRLDKKYALGDAVVLRIDKKPFVKRVVAIENDTVDVTDQGLMVNNSSQVGLENDFTKGDTLLYKDGITFPVTLTKDEVFLLNDNREQPQDGRMLGATNKKEILGKTMLIIRRRNF